MTTTTRPLASGTICRLAIQCECPDTKQTGSFLFAGELKSPGSRVSPLFPDLYELFKYVSNNETWKRVGSGYDAAYLYTGK